MYTVVMLGMKSGLFSVYGGDVSCGAGLFSVYGGDVRGEGWTVQCIRW